MVQVLILFKILLVPKSARRVESLENIHPKSSTTRYLTFWVLGIIPLDLMLMMQTSVQFSSVTQSCLTLCDPMDCSTPGLRVHHQYLELAQTHVRQVSDAIHPSHPLSSPSPPAFSLSQHQGLFQWVGSLHQVPKYWSFSLNISPSNEYSGLSSFRIDWFDLFTVQEILKSLLQHHSSKCRHLCSFITPELPG